MTPTLSYRNPESFLYITVQGSLATYRILNKNHSRTFSINFRLTLTMLNDTAPIAPLASNSDAPTIHTNPIRTKRDFNAMRAACETDLGKFHAAIAKREVHWYDAKHHAWMSFSDTEKKWLGINADDGSPIDITYPESFDPWKKSFDETSAPFYKWFSGGLTNACFNDIDRHVMLGHGDEIAFHFEGDRWDATKNGGKGGPVTATSITRKELLLTVAKCALALKNLGLKKGDRVCLNMPNIMEQIYYIEACKRLGVIYTSVFGGFSDKTLSDRIHNAGAKVVITSDGSYRNAQVAAFKEDYADKALDNYIPLEVALEISEKKLKTLKVQAKAAEKILRSIKENLSDEITVERADIMRSVGLALSHLRELSISEKSKIRTELAKALVDSPPRVKAVIVVRHTDNDITWRKERDVWSHDLLAVAEKELLKNAKKVGVSVASEKELLALDTKNFIKAIYASSPCEIVDAEFPLFFIYTSGSTGKPKGVVHVHGGYCSGVANTMRVAFDARPGVDTMYVIADPGWITGQSYMIAASLLMRVTGIVCEGSPLFPSAGRYASTIERYGVSIFKAGVTFLKSVMSNPLNAADVAQYSMRSLRVATFCAEPCSPAVQEYGMKTMTKDYINSYWATEHGGMVWTHFFGNADFPLRPDTHTYPLPWIFGDVWLPEGQDSGGRQIARVAELEEKGEIVITKPYPYLARTIWGDAEDFLKKFEAGKWKGDFDRYVKTYWNRWSDGKKQRWAYTQGDFAMKYADGSFTLHGRSDDVINVSGHRMGTEEIEGSILKDKSLNPDSPVGNVIVVGAPHREKGLTPVAFILPAPQRQITQDDMRRLSELVRKEKGAVSVPSDYIVVSAFPETRSGKYMRRFLKNMINDEPLGDTTTLRNPESLTEIKTKIVAWKKKQAVEESQEMFEAFRYFKIQYAPVKTDATMAIVTITNAPVNALNERCLDELNTVIDRLARRDDVKAVIFTGDGTKSFVAGADIKQFYEEMKTEEDALTLPNNAHLAFRKIERLKKPVIAAINGVALGGGNEFALACHYRIADVTASFGQPEINLRLLPGYGGTQRLPRVLTNKLPARDAMRAALIIMLGGRTIDADEALEIGLVHEIAVGDALSQATNLARAFITGGDAVQLKKAFEVRGRELTTWEQPQHFPKEIINDDEIKRLLNSLNHSGREKAAAKILEAVETGYVKGISKGIDLEAKLFAAAVVAPDEGKAGIEAFLNKKVKPLPSRPLLEYREADERYLTGRGELLPIDAPFFPGVTKLPTYQYAMAVRRNQVTGAIQHDVPIRAEQLALTTVPRPAPNEVLLYMLTSEVNFNDIWGITGIPVSQMEGNDQDFYVTGSGGLGLIAAVGEEVLREGRLKVGDMVTVYSGQNDLLSPMNGLDPMFQGFKIQGYETGDGSHQQFMVSQAPQCHKKPQDLTLEAAGSYVLNVGTVFRALYTTLQIESRKSIFIEGAATGTGFEALKISLRAGLNAIGLVSSEERGATVKKLGAGFVNRKAKAIEKIFTKIPDKKSEQTKWEKSGEAFLKSIKKQNGNKLVDYAVSHAGETSFPRTFQALAEGGTVGFYGASSGYHFTFMGKKGKSTPDAMLNKIKFRANEAALCYYGTGVDKSGIVDAVGLEIIETLRERKARIVVACYTNAQKEFVESLGFGDAVRGVFSIESIKIRYQEEFEWHETMNALPDAKKETAKFKEAVQEFNEKVFKPFGSEVGKALRSPDNPRGNPDVVFERAGHDALAVSTAAVKPFTGRVVYCEEMSGHRYSFYAPQVWMRQRRIYMPTANIFGTHLCNAYEVSVMNDMVDAGVIDITPPYVVPFTETAAAHQDMWDNTHKAGNYVSNHALPQLGLKTKDELFQAWSLLGKRG
jgi:acrylyl-CoA reductase (NADPH) / 3-hydroxypropionyl-CoA dehydratase / 3-hydroxypropionyl-CoA synthetase